MENINSKPNLASPLFQRKLPAANASLVLGIVSIVMCWCYGIIGIICGVIGLVLGIKAMDQYRASPEAYYASSLKNANIGKICSIVGLCLSLAFIALLVVGFIVNKEEILRHVNDLMENDFDFYF